MKTRHEKTFQEKYGLNSVMKQVLPVLRSKYRYKEDFDDLPYLGILYVNVDDLEAREKLIYYFEEPDIVTEHKSLIKVKVVKVDYDSFTIVHFDNHHMDICVKGDKSANYIIKGNEVHHINN
jgi:hypothetical protein